MKIYSIVACSKNRAIGKDNQIPWYLPADLKYFKKITSGNIIIMGRKTFESIGRPLPGRVNIVISRSKNLKMDGVLVFQSLLEALDFAAKDNERTTFIIGGGEIYRQAMPVSELIYYTEVDMEISDATVFFPEISLDDWQLISEEKHEKDEQNPFDYNFKVYRRLNPVTILAER